MNKIKILLFITITTFFSFTNISYAKAEVLEIADVLLDLEELKGSEVTVKGFFLSLGTIAFLYEELGSMNFIQVETKDAEREDRKYLLKECGSGCDIKLQGALSEQFGLVTLKLVKIVK